jgi:colanic acid/amylovoran biosynthesis glycosyltransferase
MTPAARTLLLVIQVPMYRAGDRLFCERQACNGLRLWAANFDRVTVMLPLASGPPPEGWIPLSEVGEGLDRIEIELLPTAYRPDQFLRALPGTVRRIASLIGQADYLCFSIGGLFGDWGSVACLAAHWMGRPYAVWTDRVESEVVRQGFHSGPLRRRLMARLTQPLMKRLEIAVIRRAELGLFHGRDTFEAYSPFCGGQAELVHNIHIARDDHIRPAELHAKVRDAATGPLKICYTGRAEDMKGPFDWLEALSGLQARGVDFEAVWLGDGSQRPAMLRRIAELGLEERVAMPGFTDNRAEVLRTIRQSHVFLFCHKTPESARCLIEALISGTAIFGYQSAYAADLIADNGGGVLVPKNDTKTLAARLADYASARTRLAGLFLQAKASGDPLDDVSVFRHRSGLVKTYLGQMPTRVRQPMRGAQPRPAVLEEA